MLGRNNGGIDVIQRKNALITGSSRGIGRGIALKLAEKGARVAIHYYRNRDAAEATLDSIRKIGADGFLVQADVWQPDEVRRIFQQVRSEFGSLDIFVSNARTEAATLAMPERKRQLFTKPRWRSRWSSGTLR